MSAKASHITGVSIVWSTVCSDSDKKKHQSSASLAFVRKIHRWPVNSPHKGPVTRKMIPSDDVIIRESRECVYQIQIGWTLPTVVQLMYWQWNLLPMYVSGFCKTLRCVRTAPVSRDLPKLDVQQSRYHGTCPRYVWTTPVSYDPF